MQLFTFVAAALTALISLAAAQTPGACTGTCQGWSHDPAVVRRSDGTYFRFSTANKITIATAPSISGPWTKTGSVVPNGSKINIPGKDDLWAPDIAGPFDGWYYLYYSVSTFGSQVSAIGVARSETMDAGTWEDLGATGVGSKAGSAYNAIDSHLIATSSGYYMTFGSFWGDLYQVKMASPPTKVASGVTSYQVAYQPSGSHAVEAGFIWPNNGYYFLFFSTGICCGYDNSMPAKGAEYSIKVCRSSNVNGPYVDESGVSCKSGGGTTVLASHNNIYGPGGQSVFPDVKQGGAVLVYHYINTNIGYADSQKQFGWNLLSWSTGWPVAV